MSDDLRALFLRAEPKVAEPNLREIQRRARHVALTGWMLAAGVLAVVGLASWQVVDYVTNNPPNPIDAAQPGPDTSPTVHNEGPEERPNLPEGPGETLAQGRVPESFGGEYGGKTWTVSVWSEPDRYCWGREHEGWDRPEFVCLSRSREITEHLNGWGYTVSDDGDQAFALGVLSREVHRVEFQFDDGTVVNVEVVVPPPDLEISTRYFIGHVQSFSSGDLVALDSSGAVLQRVRLPEERVDQ